MEKKVIQLCEEAKRGAEAALMEAEKAWTAWCIDALDQLNKSDITCPLLVSTQVKKIQDFASDLIVSWRNMSLEQMRDERKGSYTIPGDIEPAKIEKVDKRTSEECQEISGVGIVKVQKVDQNATSLSSNVVRPESVVTEKTNSSDNLSRSMIRCNDCFREVVREKVCDALSKVSGEADEEIRDEVNACDSVRVAIALESAMFEKWDRYDGPYKIKYKAVLGNLKDPKNPDFRRNVHLGQVKPETIVGMTAKEMAGDKMLSCYQR
ncbi:transcription elongation factor TFIIS [Citrus sinensis]|nr:transcription elongation factor TFIIS [Citrus sinensis]